MTSRILEKKRKLNLKKTLSSFFLFKWSVFNIILDNFLKFSLRSWRYCVVVEWLGGEAAKRHYNYLVYSKSNMWQLFPKNVSCIPIWVDSLSVLPNVSKCWVECVIKTHWFCWTVEFWTENFPTNKNSAFSIYTCLPLLNSRNIYWHQYEKETHQTPVFQQKIIAFASSRLSFFCSQVSDCINTI